MDATLTLRSRRTKGIESGFAGASLHFAVYKSTRLQDYKWLRYRFAMLRRLQEASLSLRRLQDYKWLRYCFATASQTTSGSLSLRRLQDY